MPVRPVATSGVVRRAPGKEQDIEKKAGIVAALAVALAAAAPAMAQQPPGGNVAAMMTDAHEAADAARACSRLDAASLRFGVMGSVGPVRFLPFLSASWYWNENRAVPL